MFCISEEGEGNRRASRARQQDSSKSNSSHELGGRGRPRPGNGDRDVANSQRDLLSRWNTALPEAPSHGHSLVGRGEVPDAPGRVAGRELAARSVERAGRGGGARSRGSCRSTDHRRHPRGDRAPESARSTSAAFHGVPARASRRPTSSGSRKRRRPEDVDEHPAARRHRAGSADAGRRPRQERPTAGRDRGPAHGSRVRRRAAADDGRRVRRRAGVRSHDAVTFLARRGPGPRGRGAAGHHGGGERARLRGDPEAPGPARGREPRLARGDHRRGGGGRDHRGLRRAARRARACRRAWRRPTRPC